MIGSENEIFSVIFQKTVWVGIFADFVAMISVFFLSKNAIYFKQKYRILKNKKLI